MQTCMIDAALDSGAIASRQSSASKPWDTESLREMRSARRSCKHSETRKALSKQIAKETGRALKAWQTKRLHDQLLKFESLGELARICSEPVKSKKTLRPPNHEFAQSLQAVYESAESPHDVGDLSLLRYIEHFNEVELQTAFNQLSKGKCADKHGVVLEMFASGGSTLHDVLLGILNHILTSGDLPAG